MSFILITQEVNDLLSSDAGNSVLANTAWKLLLRQDPSVIDTITRTFKLNYAETMLLMNATPGEGLLMAYNNRIPLKVIASKREYDIVTTKPEDLLRIERKTQQKPPETPQEPKKRFSITKKVQLKNELNKGQIDILKRDGFHEVRDPGLSPGSGSLYLVKNKTGETDPHFIMWNLIYGEVRKYTDNVSFNLTREPDVVFTAADGRSVAVEVEGARKSENDLLPKLNVLQKFDEWFFVITSRLDREHYQKYGTTISRVAVQEKIKSYFVKTEPQEKPKPKTGGDSSPVQETGPPTDSD